MLVLLLSQVFCLETKAKNKTLELGLEIKTKTVRSWTHKAEYIMFSKESSLQVVMWNDNRFTENRFKNR